MSITSSYSYIDVTCTLNQRSILGMWEGDDAIAVSEGEDIGTGLIGADGSGIFSQHAGKGAQISIKLQHTSPTHRYLTQLLEQQREGGLNGVPFTVQDRRSGEGGTADKCFIMQAPATEKGKAATMREWVLWTSQYDRSIPNG